MLYIHIPYCQGKCIYCDFYSTGLSNRKEFLKALVAELSYRRKELDECLSSVYIGGGTPSLLTAGEFSWLADKLHSFFNSEGISFSDDFEFTLEVNPEDVSPEKLAAWKKAGVNRLSMGVQSLNQEELSFLHRRHNRAKALKSIESVADCFDNFSLDFIYGIPGQTPDTLQQTLSEALSFRPPHVSVYALTYETGTPLELLLRHGKVKSCDEELYNLMDRQVSSQLRQAGMERYEISNYALPGFRARHNSGYWKFKPYLGLGPGASSYNGLNVRRTNPSDLKGYISYFSEPSKHDRSFYEEEVLDCEANIIETIMVSLRCREGIGLEKFKDKFGPEDLELLLKRGKRFIESGDLILSENRLHLSENGIYLSDYIIRNLL